MACDKVYWCCGCCDIVTPLENFMPMAHDQETCQSLLALETFLVQVSCTEDNQHFCATTRTCMNVSQN